MNEEIDMQLSQAKSIALDIDEGKNSRYWSHLKRKINSWYDSERKHLELMNQRLIKASFEIEQRNDCVKRIALLKQFYEINETIIKENLNIIEAMSGYEDMRKFRNTNFVE